MGDFGMSQLQQTEKVQITQQNTEKSEQGEEQKKIQGQFLQNNNAQQPYTFSDRKEWKKLQEKAGALNFTMPTGVAIGSPIQQEPAEDDKTKKEREKKLAKIKKKGCGQASHGSVVLQEKVSASQVSREAMEKQIEKDRKKGIDEKTLQKEYAKQNLIRAFSNNIRTDRSGKPIIRIDENTGEPDENDENFKALKSNEAFKNNFEGHMSGVVQWIYQVDLNPDVMLTDAYVKNHSSELFQTAERLKTFFDYYELMGNEEWERGFLNDDMYVGESGKEILAIKAEQAKNFRAVLSDKFKTLLSVDMETGEFLTDKQIQESLSQSAQQEAEKKLQNLSKAEQECYQRMAEEDFKEFRKGEAPKLDTEFKDRYDKLIASLDDSENLQVKKYGNVARDIRRQLKDNYDNLNFRIRRGNYDFGPTVLGMKLQEARDKELEEEKNRMKKSLEVARFFTQGGKIEFKSTLDTLLNVGYPADDLIERYYRFKGGIVDQTNEILKQLEVRQIEGGEKESPKECEERLIIQSSIVTRMAIQRATRENSLNQPTDAERKQVLQELTDAEREQALQEVRSSTYNSAIEVLLGRGGVGETVLKLAANSMAGYDLKEKYAPDMRSFMDNNTNLKNTSQATLDYVNLAGEKKMYENDEVMRYFTRVKELIGDAKFFEVIKDGKKDEKETNRRFTAFLLQDFTNHYTGAFTGVLKKGEIPEQMGSRFKEFTSVAASLQKIAAYDTTGKNYDNNETMQRALNTYREMADRVAIEIDKRAKEKKTA